MEYIRGIKIKVEIDTNKETYTNEFEEVHKAAEFIFGKMTDEQRLDIMSNYCKYCGCADSDCQCWNDD